MSNEYGISDGNSLVTVTVLTLIVGVLLFFSLKKKINNLT